MTIKVELETSNINKNKIIRIETNSIWTKAKTDAFKIHKFR